MTQIASKVTTMKYVLFLLAILFTCAGISYSADNSSGKNALLQDRHKTAEVSCADCHHENPPGKQVPTSRCIGCHGDYKKLAELTRKTDPNPHDHHEGTLDCASCHHVHKKSEDYCLRCHSWGYKVP